MSVIGSNILAGASGGAVDWAGDVISTQDNPSDSKHRLYAYTFDDGFGSRFTPSTAPSSNPRMGGLALHPDNTAVAIGISGSPYIEAYAYTVGTGFGSKFSNPSSLPTDDGNAMDFHPDGDVLVTNQTGGSLITYAWSSSGFGTKYSAPSSDATARGSDCDWHPTGDAFVSGVFASPCFEAWAWSGSGWGSKYTATTFTGTECRSIRFNTAGNVLGVMANPSPFIHAFAWTNANGFGTKFSDPSTALESDGNGIFFHPDDDAVICGQSSHDLLNAYAWDNSSGFGTKYSAPSGVPGSARRVVFSPDGRYVFMNHNSSPYISCWEWDSSTGFGSKLANPATLPENSGRGLHCTYP